MSTRQNIQTQPPGALARLVLVRFAAVLATLTAGAALLATSAVPAAAAEGGCANEARRVEQASTFLPDCRAYEQVSPVDKNDSDVKNDFQTILNQQASVDGDEILYEAFGAFPGAPSGRRPIQYLASRSASGWSTRAVGHPLTASQLPAGAKVGYWLPLSPDLSTGVLRQADPPLVAGAPAGYANLYVGQLATGSYQLVSTVTPPNEGPGGQFKDIFEGASADFSHVIFVANDALTPNAPNPGRFGLNLYEEVGGQLQLVGQIPAAGTSCTGAACTPADESFGGAAPSQLSPTPDYENAISADGSRIFFSASADSGAQSGLVEVYERVDGSSTVEVSAPAAAVTPSSRPPSPRPTRARPRTDRWCSSRAARS